MNMALLEPLDDFGGLVGVACAANERGWLERCMFAKGLIAERCSDVS
jgi:hypothetical protein